MRIEPCSLLSLLQRKPAKGINVKAAQIELCLFDAVTEVVNVFQQMHSCGSVVAVKELARETNHPLTCLIDSNGTVPFEHFPELMAVCDGVMLDVKAWDADLYHRLTQAKDNAIVKQNLVWLLQHDLLTEIRIVCLPDRVDVETILRHIAETFDFIGKNAPVRLLRFRPHGVIGELANHPMPTEEQMAQHAEFARSLHLAFSIK